jgi:hypothetical protein
MSLTILMWLEQKLFLEQTTLYYNGRLQNEATFKWRLV